jgi:tRNA pseudouridine38-40 synthase
VHARGQVVSFALERAFAPEALTRALNALTAPDLRVVRTAHAPDGFHARTQATARQYAYHVGTDAAAYSPFRRRYEWAYGSPLDGRLLAATAAPLLGEHDFRAFAAAGQAKPHYRCRVITADWRQRHDAEGFIFVIEADRFLHRMVRFLVGMAVDVASGRRPADDVARLLGQTDNAEASPPAPPEGLYLVRVHYPQLDEDPA